MFNHLGHHRDDQAETVLFNALRGSGIAGLAGMPVVRVWSGPPLLRPFLEVPRTSLHAYAAEFGLSWLDDPSNADIALRRNFLRHSVLPSIETGMPQARVALARLAMSGGAAAGASAVAAAGILGALHMSQAMDVGVGRASGAAAAASSFSAAAGDVQSGVSLADLDTIAAAGDGADDVTFDDEVTSGARAAGRAAGGGSRRRLGRGSSAASVAASGGAAGDGQWRAASAPTAAARASPA